MTQLGNDILTAILGNATTMLLVPGVCNPVLIIRRADGSTEQRELGDVAIVPVLDMPAEFTDIKELCDARAATA